MRPGEKESFDPSANYPQPDTIPMGLGACARFYVVEEEEETAHAPRHTLGLATSLLQEHKGSAMLDFTQN